MKRLILTLSLLSMIAFFTQAQEDNKQIKKEKDEKSITIKIKEGADPIIYIDGKQYDKDIIDIIDKNKIKSIKVIKPDIEITHGESPHVVIIKTKPGKDEEEISIAYDFDFEYDFDYDFDFDFDEFDFEMTDEPIVIINGEHVFKDSLKKISKDDIIHIQILKDEEDLKKYKTKNGVIIVTTKKKKKDAKK